MNRKAGLLYLGAAVSLVSLLVIRMLLGFWIPFLWIPIGLLILFLGLAVRMDAELYKKFFTTKTTKQGLSQGTLIFLVLLLLIAVNFISSRKNKSWDFSIAQVNSLSDQSIKLIKSLDDELKVIYFYQRGQEGIEENRRQFVELIQKYRNQSDRIKLDFIEVNERPDLVEKYGVASGNGVVFLDYKGRTNQIQKIDEQELTGALVKVLREKDKNIYFISGHGEKSINDDGANGLLPLKKLLEGNRYKVMDLPLLSATAVPDDADAVFIVGPTQSYIENELKVLDGYIKRGGRLIVALDPGAKHNLHGLLKKNGIELKNNYIAGYLDTPIGKAVSPQSTAGSEFSTESPITKPFPAGQYAVFRLPQHLALNTKEKDFKFEELVKVSKNVAAFSDTNFQGAGQLGEFTIAARVQTSTKAEILIFGDSDFLAKSMLYLNLNRDLVLNSVAYLVKEENLISITPKEINKTELVMTPTKFYLFIFGFIVLLPLSLLIVSGTLWFKRRYA